ncbi:MBL fold metallo-hydrolase [Flavisphingomonas formosensis]|uniref:MBL fold metallo-hydrolase n=1 Tax=Flavisphingomonas formosensis TaxID=861534 RepID=UPI0012F786AD|nr:MBL fold metallo-hydrolase [Sphingomonas formosensis]
MKLRILGCGTSSGVPRIGNDWGDCDPAEPRNRRTRASILIESDTTRILVDTAPDMREQLLAADINHIDAVIWTHDHADHCHGIDDLRQIFHMVGHPIDAYARLQPLRTLQQRFDYAFEGRDGYPPTVYGRILPDRLTIGDIGISVVDQPHGSIWSSGLCFEREAVRIGYSTDFNSFTDDMRMLFEGVDVWVVDALRRSPHPTHAHLAATLDWIAQCRPGRALLTHMDQSMDYAALLAELPPGVAPAYDGLEVSLP